MNPHELLERIVLLAQQAHTNPEAAMKRLNEILELNPNLKDATESLSAALNEIQVDSPIFAFQPAALSNGELERPIRKIAIVMDFDDTLSVENSFPKYVEKFLLLAPEELMARFRKQSDYLKENGIHDRTALLTVINERLDELLTEGKGFRDAEVMEYGSTVPLAKGLVGDDNFFDRMRVFSAERGLDLEFHMISCSAEEVVKGSQVAGEFTTIRGSQFCVNREGFVEFEADSLDYTLKPTVVAEISMGIVEEGMADSNLVNRRHAIHVPIENMVAVGDGITDIAFMDKIRTGGGAVVGIFNEEKPSKYAKILDEDKRTDFLVHQDYSHGSKLDAAFKTVIEAMATRIDRAEAAFEKAAAGKDRTSSNFAQMPAEADCETQKLGVA